MADEKKSAAQVKKEKANAAKLKKWKEFAESVKKQFNPEKVTGKGHTKYVPFNVGSISCSWKPEKPMRVHISQYETIDINQVTKPQIQALLDNFDDLQNFAQLMSGDTHKDGALVLEL